MRREATKEANDRNSAEALYRRDRRKLYDAVQAMLDHAVECQAYRRIIEEEHVSYPVGPGYPHTQHVGEGHISVTVTGAATILLEALKRAVL